MEETIGYEALLSRDEWDSLELDEPPHEAKVTYDVRYSIDCELCGPVGSADDEQLAQLIARLHDSLIATVVGQGSAR